MPRQVMAMLAEQIPLTLIPLLVAVKKSSTYFKPGAMATCLIHAMMTFANLCHPHTAPAAPKGMALWVLTIITPATM